MADYLGGTVGSVMTTLQHRLIQVVLLFAFLLFLYVILTNNY